MPRSTEQYMGYNVTIVGRTLCRRLVVRIPEGYLAMPSYFNVTGGRASKPKLTFKAVRPNGEKVSHSVTFDKNHLAVYQEFASQIQLDYGLFALPKNIPSLVWSRRTMFDGIPVPSLVQVKRLKDGVRVSYTDAYDGTVEYGWPATYPDLERMINCARQEAELSFLDYRNDHRIDHRTAVRCYDTLRQLEGCVSLLDREYAIPMPQYDNNDRIFRRPIL